MTNAADQELVKRQEILDKSQRRQMGVEIRRRWEDRCLQHYNKEKDKDKDKDMDKDKDKDKDK